MSIHLKLRKFGKIRKHLLAGRIRIAGDMLIICGAVRRIGRANKKPAEIDAGRAGVYIHAIMNSSSFVV
jgi:hypothetical protein